MKWFLIAVTGVLLMVILLAAGFLLAAESDEVVTLTLTDGTQHRLWIVDHNNHAWLRRGDGRGWISEVTAQQTLELERAGVSATYRYELISSGPLRDRVNELTLEKYGLAEQYLRLLMLNPSQAIAVKLIPIDG